MKLGARPKTKSNSVQISPINVHTVEDNSERQEKADQNIVLNLETIEEERNYDAEIPSTAPPVKVTLPQKVSIFDKKMGKDTNLGRFLDREKSVQNVGQTQRPKMSDSPARKRIVKGTVSRILTKFESIEKLKNMPPEDPPPPIRQN